MKLVDLQVKNYRCIMDSTPFTVDQLTCLVGKNESGKSAILQALYKLNPFETGDIYNSLYEYPKMHQADYEAGDIDDGDEIIISRWRFIPEEISEIEDKFGKDVFSDKSIVTVSNGYKNKKKWDVAVDFQKLFSHMMNTTQIDEEDRSLFSDISSPNTVRQDIKKISSPSDQVKAFCSWFNTSFPNDAISSFAEREFLPYLPKFSYYSEYQKLPGRISLTDYANKKNSNTLSRDEKVFDALLNLASTTIDDVRNANKLEELINKTRAISSKISQEIFTYWSQNKHLKVEFRYDMAKSGDEPPFNNGYVFSTRIENTRHDSSVSFDDRSTGFVWFFSFLIWFNYIQKKEKNLVILLDEPGLTLHAKAQSDLIRFFKEKIIQKFQLIYTTHSPFMLDFSDLLSARTVEDASTSEGNVLGTKVGSRVFSKDKDTIFPLQAAFGYDITQTLFIGKNTLLVEGPSDIQYLTYFSNQLEGKGRIGLSKDWTICPTGGIDKIQSFVSLFGGNALNVAALTDYHENDRKKIDKLKASGILESSHILVASDYTKLSTSDIEDIIGNEAYIKLINRCYSLVGDKAIAPSSDSDGKIVQYVEIKLSGIEGIKFNHYTPSEYLICHPSMWTVSEIKVTLDRFEQLFIDINKML